MFTLLFCAGSWTIKPVKTGGMTKERCLEILNQKAKQGQKVTVIEDNGNSNSFLFGVKVKVTEEVENIETFTLLGVKWFKVDASTWTAQIGTLTVTAIENAGETLHKWEAYENGVLIDQGWYEDCFGECIEKAQGWARWYNMKKAQAKQG